MDILKKLQNNNETIIIIEHNVEFIARMSNWLIDFGLHGGHAGGNIIAQGYPREVFNNKESSLYGL